MRLARFQSGGGEMIEIKENNKQTSSCDACGAFNSKSDLSLNKRTNRLTEIYIGRSLNPRIILCDDCLDELLKKIVDYKFPKHGTLIDGDKLKGILLDMWINNKSCNVGKIMGEINQLSVIAE